MSSFINSAKHFNSIEQKLRRLLHRDFRAWSALENVAPNIYKHWTNNCLGKSDEKEITAIIDTLRELQVLCVTLQYKHHYEGDLDAQMQAERVSVKTKTETVNLSLHGLYNALECIRYQIETEHLIELLELTPVDENAMTFVAVIPGQITI